MKKTEHQKIIKLIVDRKNEEAAAIREILEADRDFWLAEAIMTYGKLADAIDLLSEASESILSNDKLIAKLKNFIETAWR